MTQPPAPKKKPVRATRMDEDEERRLQELEFLQAEEAFALDDIQDFCAVAENTDNPLFLWKALSAWSDANFARSKLGLEQLEMPQQIRAYLSIAAKRINDLSEGLDYRETPEPFGKLPRVSKSVDVARKRTRTLNAPQATKLALHAFGLRRDGWNAFQRGMTLRGQDLDALLQELYRSDMGEGKTIEALLEDHLTNASQVERRRLEDVRGLRKRIKASRDARRSK